jgi:hypothetical protein
MKNSIQLPVLFKQSMLPFILLLAKRLSGPIATLLILWAFAFFLNAGLANQAQACRDCPFPLKIAEGRWLLPSGELEVVIEEVELPKRQKEVQVSLVNVRTRQVAAMGKVRQRADRKTVTLELTDSDGRIVKAVIRYMDPQRDVIMAKFSCNLCVISEFIQ